jgi:hypothetical protein
MSQAEAEALVVTLKALRVMPFAHPYMGGCPESQSIALLHGDDAWDAVAVTV